MTSLSDMCLEILQKSSDGNGLSPAHLRLVEVVVNGAEITEAGEVAFYDLHKAVASGSYQKPWHFGVEGVTKDHDSYVYWRGVQVEHFSHSDPEREKVATERLAKVCRAIEVDGKDVGLKTYFEYLDKVET